MVKGGKKKRSKQTFCEFFRKIVFVTDMRNL